jgi:hypothetical protein
VGRWVVLSAALVAPSVVVVLLFHAKNLLEIANVDTGADLLF